MSTWASFYSPGELAVYRMQTTGTALSVRPMLHHCGKHHSQSTNGKTGKKSCWFSLSLCVQTCPMTTDSDPSVASAYRLAPVYG